VTETNCKNRSLENGSFLGGWGSWIVEQLHCRWIVFINSIILFLFFKLYIYFLSVSKLVQTTET
jgi:hypothetical protein